MIRKVTALPHQELSVALTNADTNREPVSLIVIHTMVGTISSANSRFNDPSSKVSAHYGVGFNGQIVHWVDEDWVAYHAGNYSINQQSIGIEHEDYGNYNSPRPDALYITSSQLVADICKFYQIPCDRKHILKHSEIVATGCPDALDVDRIVSGAQAILNQSTSTTSNNVQLTQDQINALQSLESYRTVRAQGPEGNFEGFVNAIIGSDRNLPIIQQELNNLQTSTVSVPVSINSTNIISKISSFLNGKKTFIVSGLIIAWSQLKAMGYIDDATYQFGISILGALGLAAIRLGISGN